MEHNNAYVCEACDKKYKHRQSLYRHNRKFHTKNEHNITKKSSLYNHNIIKKTSFEAKINTQSLSKYKCNYCDKSYKHYQNKWRHEKKCKEDIKIEKEKIEKYNMELKKCNIELQKNNDELRQMVKDLINSKAKVNQTTFNKIRKQNNTNIGTQNNIQIVGFSQEQLYDLFTKKEKAKILKHHNGSIFELIKKVHFNEKYPELQNIMITNYNNKIGYKYDSKVNDFVAIPKDELISDVITYRMTNLEEFKEDCEDKLNDNDIKKINKLINDFDDNENKFINDRKDKVKLLIYNKK